MSSKQSLSIKTKRGNRLPSIPQSFNSTISFSLGVEFNPTICTRDSLRVKVPSLESLYQWRYRSSKSKKGCDLHQQVYHMDEMHPEQLDGKDDPRTVC